MAKHIYQQLEASEYKNLVTSKNAEGLLLVTKMTDAEIVAHNLVQANEKQISFEKQMGFRMIMNMLMETKVPLVGHNCFFDIMFILRWFDAPLEQEFSAFRTRLAKNFPNMNMFDTK